MVPCAMAMCVQASKMKNVRWYNPKTEEFSWEDPKLSTPWREINGKGKGGYTGHMCVWYVCGGDTRTQ